MLDMMKGVEEEADCYSYSTADALVVLKIEDLGGCGLTYTKNTMFETVCPLPRLNHERGY